MYRFLLLFLYSWKIFDPHFHSIDIAIEIFCEPEKYEEEWHTDEKPEKSSDMFWDEKYDKCDKYWEVNIGWYNFWIEVVCLDRMDDSDHRYTREYDSDATLRSAISISKYEYRYSWDECTKYRDKSTDKYYKRESEDKWKCYSSMNKADDEKSYGGEYSICKSYDRLRLKNKSESASDFFWDHRPFFIEESEVSIAYLTEKSLDLLPIDDKKIWEYQRDEELREYDTSICDIGDSIFSQGFEIIWAHEICCETFESEIETRTLLDPRDEVLPLARYPTGFPEKSLDLRTDLWEDVRKDEDDYTYKDDIEWGDDDICGSIFLGEYVRCICLPTDSPVVDHMSEIGSEFEKYIRKEKCDKKEYEKVTK